MITASVIDFTVHLPSTRQKTVFRGPRIQRNFMSKEAIDEVKKWRTSFNHVSGTPEQFPEARIVES